MSSSSSKNRARSAQEMSTFHPMNVIESCVSVINFVKHFESEEFRDGKVIHLISPLLACNTLESRCRSRDAGVTMLESRWRRRANGVPILVGSLESRPCVLNFLLFTPNFKKSRPKLAKVELWEISATEID